MHTLHTVPHLEYARGKARRSLGLQLRPNRGQQIDPKVPLQRKGLPQLRLAVAVHVDRFHGAVVAPYVEPAAVHQQGAHARATRAAQAAEVLPGRRCSCSELQMENKVDA